MRIWFVLALLIANQCVLVMSFLRAAARPMGATLVRRNADSGNSMIDILSPMLENSNAPPPSPQSYAYIGDVVYELLVRTSLLYPLKKTNDYHTMVVNNVRAEFQSSILKKLMTGGGGVRAERGGGEKEKWRGRAKRARERQTTKHYQKERRSLSRVVRNMSYRRA